MEQLSGSQTIAIESGLQLSMSHKERLAAMLNRIGLSPASFLLFIVLGLAPIVIDDQYIVHLMITSLMFGTLAMGFDLSAGFINVANFGYAAFMGVGGYTSAILMERLHVNPWMGIFIGTVLAAFLGFLTGILTLRLRGMFTAILAWFLGLTMMALCTQLVDLTRGSLGLIVTELFDTYSKTPYYYTIYAICLTTYILIMKIISSKWGLAFKTVGQDQEAAESIGVNPTFYKILNFTISCAVAGLVGGFYAHFTGILTPEVLHTKHAVEVLVIAYIGGRGSIWGGLVCAFLVIPLMEYARPIMEFRYVLYGMALIVVMIFYPGGFAEFYNNRIREMLHSRKKKV